MEGSRCCKNCKKKRVIRDEITGNWVCESCGVEQEFDNFQVHFGGINGPQGTFVRVGSSAPSFSTQINGQKLYFHNGDFNYKENKIYKAQKRIEDITSKLEFSSKRSSEVKQMIEEITDGEFGIGDWFTILIGACSYVVMRKNNLPFSMADAASVVGCDLHELGRMIIRVVDFLHLNLPEFDIVSSFERAIQTCPSFADVSSEKMDKMVKQGRFLLQCAVKWFLTTGRQPIPVVVAALVFVAELNEVDVSIEDVAKEMHGGVATSRKRHKELQETLVKVAQALPWGKNVTVKNIVKNAPFVIQYMEMKSRSKPGEKRKNAEMSGLNLEEMVNGCLRKETDYAMDGCYSENDSQYFDVEDKNQILNVSFDDLDKLKISLEGLSRIYTEFSNNNGFNKSMYEVGDDHKRKRRNGSLQLSKEWWTGKSNLSKKLSLEQILEMNVGFNGMPPSFVAGELACKRRREKINAAKLRIDDILQPPNTVSGDEIGRCFLERLQARKQMLREAKGCCIDWEDFIIEILLLHQVEEEEIEQGHYNRLLDLHVFNSGNVHEMLGNGRKH